MLQAARIVFRKKAYLFLAASVSLISLAFLLWLPNFGLVLARLFEEGSILERTALPWSLLGTLSTNFTFFSALTMVVLVTLFGINVSCMVYALRRRIRTSKRGGIFGAFGALLSLFTIGCFACGSFLFAPLLVTIGGTAFLALLPLGGGELALLGIVFLGYSIFLTAREITTSLSCRISN